MEIRPLHDRLLVKRLPEEATTAGGLIIPDNARERPLQAIVVAVGDGVTSDVKPGDRVVHARYAGDKVRALEDGHLLIREEDVLGVVEA